MALKRSVFFKVFTGNDMQSPVFSRAFLLGVVVILGDRKDYGDRENDLICPWDAAASFTTGAYSISTAISSCSFVLSFLYISKAPMLATTKLRK